MDKEIMTTISVRISQEEKNRLQVVAKDSGITMSQIIRRAIKKIIEEK